MMTSICYRQTAILVVLYRLESDGGVLMARYTSLPIDPQSIRARLDAVHTIEYKIMIPTAQCPTEYQAFALKTIHHQRFDIEALLQQNADLKADIERFTNPSHIFHYSHAASLIRCALDHLNAYDAEVWEDASNDSDEKDCDGCVSHDCEDCWQDHDDDCASDDCPDCPDRWRDHCAGWGNDDLYGDDNWGAM